jgi:hypothetical protein
MKRLLFVACALLVLSGCVSTKPWFFTAEKQDKRVDRIMVVLYDDFSEDDVIATVNSATKEFVERTNIQINVIEYRQIKWQSHNMFDMSNQALEAYPNHSIPAHWVLMIYRKTPLEWVLMFLIGNVEGAAEAGGNWAFVNRLSPHLIIHELYHLGWKIK